MLIRELGIQGGVYLCSSLARLPHFQVNLMSWVNKRSASDDSDGHGIGAEPVGHCENWLSGSFPDPIQPNTLKKKRTNVFVEHSSPGIILSSLQ